MHRDEGGYIVVETIAAFLLFTLLVISILSLINIVTVQTRIHYALTQTATELSMYSYVIDALGLTKDVKDLDKTGQEVQDQINGVIEDLDTINSGLTTPPGNTAEFFDNLDAVLDAVGSLGSQAQSIVQDPKGTLIRAVRYGLNESKNFAMQKLVMLPMLEKYLNNGNMDADTALKSFGISRGLDGLDLSQSVFIDQNGDITVSASYEIDYTFGALPLPFTTIHVEQTAKTRAWLGGVKND